MEKKIDYILKVENVKKYFPIREGIFRRSDLQVKAVDGVSFTIEKGKTLGLVGESGCGKTTLGRCITRLKEVTDGSIFLEGKNISKLNRTELRSIRKDIQIIFQDPFSSLNPRMNVEQIIEEAFIVHKLVSPRERREKIIHLLDIVGLSKQSLVRYPHEFSGGQRQRISIARALAVQPKVIIADEPVSALDVSIQAQIINLLLDLQKQFGIAFLFISHDLGVIRHVSDKVAVMYLGRIVEFANTKDLYDNPLHPYTEALLSVVPVPDIDYKRNRISLIGDVPAPIAIPVGCRFYSRCPIKIDECKKNDPTLLEVSKQHWVACIRAEQYATKIHF